MSASDFTPGDAAMDIVLSEAGFVHGAQSCREMLARFVENSAPTDPKVLAGSMRANWHPGWGVDPGHLTGEIPDNRLGHLALEIELLDIEREADANLIAAASKLYNGCNAMLGLVRLILGRDDLSPELREVLTTNHRIAEAEAATAKARGESPSTPQDR